VIRGLTGQDDITGELRLECGAVIVGSGAGGATMAAELAECLVVPDHAFEGIAHRASIGPPGARPPGDGRAYA